MTPRDSIDIATAALRWSTAYERRRALGRERRQAGQAYREGLTPVLSGAFDRWRDAVHRVTEARRVERVAMRALAKACAKVRGDLRDAEVVDERQPPPRLQHDLSTEERTR